ncbi:hypothetical protein [Halopseudomonas maritima]|uniref:hypothetical protein n=1 Tax=Halopseudomonas maritima TaxID=2918528 RepID=UPI001EEC469B|nr:hypothetical protein [Halopseudomonas maritima]UJJ31093.1 hypothetical protein HV822_15195 [Halopseudomonas maritima]
MGPQVYVQVCSTFDQSGQCVQAAWQLAYLASDSTEFEAFTSFDPQAFWLGFGSTVTCFFVGFGIGLLAALFRKMRG